MRCGRRLSGAGLMFTLALMAAGCGSASASSPGHQTSRSAASTPSATASPMPKTAPKFLRPVPAFSVKDTHGQTIMVPSGHTTILYFMAAWCGSCAVGERSLAHLQSQFPPGVHIISLDVTPQVDTPAALENLATLAGATWPQAFASTAVLAAYKITSLDTLAVVSSKGQLMYEGPLPPLPQLLSFLHGASEAH